jgi:beta-glucoside operon transcriptional antiterminator
MQAIKKINNNVAICKDGNGKELIAFGKGIGFPNMPYQLTDLSKIDRTFYNIDSKYICMINEIPVDIIEFSAQIIDKANSVLYYELNANAVLTLADHIAFSIERAKKNIQVRMPLSYEVAQTYPLEMEIAENALKEIKERFHVQLKSDEAAGITMNLVNARLTHKIENEIIFAKVDQKEILEDITEIIEKELKIKVNRKTFNYARYATHMEYLLKRLYDQKNINTDNLVMYAPLRAEFQQISNCVDKISTYIDESFHRRLCEEEKLYLILHVNRICAKEGL